MPPDFEISPETIVPPEWRGAVQTAIEAEELIRQSPEALRFVFAAKIVAAIIVTLLGIGILVLLFRLRFFAAKATAARSFVLMRTPAEKEKISNEWERVKRRMAQGGEADLRLAVIEADQLLDALLKRIGFKGDTMAERLERVKPWQLANLQDVWVAHKMRNRLVHEPQIKISAYDAEVAVGTFEKALKALGALNP